MVNCSSAHERGFRGAHPLEIVAMVLGFIFFWPIGLAILVFKLCGGHFPINGAEGGWRRAFFGNSDAWNRPWAAGPSWSSWQGFGGFGARGGNSAFEDYKRATLERLEAERRRLAEEERAFADFLRELRSARDREEFDRFMQSRRQQQNGGSQGPAAS
jgi:hypothetical protein